MMTRTSEPLSWRIPGNIHSSISCLYFSTPLTFGLSVFRSIKKIVFDLDKYKSTLRSRFRVGLPRSTASRIRRLSSEWFGARPLRKPVHYRVNLALRGVGQIAVDSALQRDFIERARYDVCACKPPRPPGQYRSKYETLTIRAQFPSILELRPFC